MSETPSITINGDALNLQLVDQVLAGPVNVVVPKDVWSRVEESAAQVSRIVQENRTTYGINTGFGHLCMTRVMGEELAELQANLIRSHAVGVGPAMPDPLVRLLMILKINALCRGCSGISRHTLQCLLSMVNADIIPVVPTKGSLGASGDLAPLAHVVLAMIGEGRARVHGSEMSAAAALDGAGIETPRLGPKEGLALINGTQFMLSYLSAIMVRARYLLRHADIVAACTVDGMLGSVAPFDERLHALRPHPGAMEVARNVTRLTGESEIVASHANCSRVQDPYSLRCVPQVHGASRDAIRHVREVVERELNAVTDNPVILDDGAVISGGLFHGQPLALAADYAAIAIAELASISERRSYLLLSGQSDLPVSLSPNAGLNSGFMILQYTAAALVSENKGLCSPSSVDTIPTSLGQEDHVSMGARAAVKCLEVLENTETVLAIEQLCAAQALDFRAPLGPGKGTGAAHAVIRQAISHADMDRTFGEDIARSLNLLRGREILRTVEQEIGELH
ncbi:MAG: histidine ammonia-lyase [Planctomycetota bacterium]|jgi:histidine ammonia-lyase